MINTLTRILLTFSTLLILNCKAQEFPKEGDNIINVNLNKYIGTWNWSNGTESIQLIFKKENVKLPIGNNIKADVLYGFHKYIKNNIVVESSTQFINSEYADKKSTLFAVGNRTIPNSLGVSIYNMSKKKNIDAQIEYLDPTHIKIVNLKNYEGLRINTPGQPPFDWSISLPQNIILTKE